MASKTSLPQQNTSCTTEDLVRKMFELSLKYEEVKNLKEILTEKEAQIDSLKKVVVGKEVYIFEVEDAKKQVELKYSKIRRILIGKNHSMEIQMFYGIIFLYKLQNL